MKWAIFCSGWGRSASILIEQFENNKFENAVLDSIICTGQNTKLTHHYYKQNYNIINVLPQRFATRSAWQEFLAENLESRGVKFIFLCGFKYRIHKVLLDKFPNRILNIHPSLLPAFKNTQNAIQEAIQLGVEVTGITTHIIDIYIDEGMIIYQEPIRIGGLKFEAIDKKFVEACPLVLKKSVRKVMTMYKERQKRYLKKSAYLTLINGLLSAIETISISEIEIFTLTL